MNDARSRSADVAIGAHRYTLESDDEYLTRLGDRFEPHTERLLCTLFAPGSVVVDVGANIGCTSILFAQRARRVLAFEASPSTFAFLHRNIERAGLRNVELHNEALGAEPGVSQLTYAVVNRAGGFVSAGTPTSSGHVTETITIARLDDAVRRAALDSLDLLKIDVEGFEKSVLDGGVDTLRRFAPVVALELNHWCLNAFHRISVPDFLDYLCARFPVLFAVQGETYLDVHEPAERYIVMYHNINHVRYADLVGAQSREQLAGFFPRYEHRT
jgi:FkbM family methyltransferase